MITPRSIRELLKLANAWLRPPADRAHDLRLPLLIAALFLMLVEALITRMGWALPVLSPAAGRKAKAPAPPPRERPEPAAPRPQYRAPAADQREVSALDLGRRRGILERRSCRPVAGFVRILTEAARLPLHG